MEREKSAPNEEPKMRSPPTLKLRWAKVGAARFELATSWSQTRRDNRATLRPAKLGCKNKGSEVHYKTNIKLHNIFNAWVKNTNM
jgi:hypothetical protein